MRDPHRSPRLVAGRVRAPSRTVVACRRGRHVARRRPRSSPRPASRRDGRAFRVARYARGPRCTWPAVCVARGVRGPRCARPELWAPRRERPRWYRPVGCGSCWGAARVACGLRRGRHALGMARTALPVRGRTRFGEGPASGASSPWPALTKALASIFRIPTRAASDAPTASPRHPLGWLDRDLVTGNIGYSSMQDPRLATQERSAPGSGLWRGAGSKRSEICLAGATVRSTRGPEQRFWFRTTSRVGSGCPAGS